MSADDHDHGDHHHRSELSEMQLRVRALETILTQKGYVDPTALNVIIETYETKIGPHVGARVVAKALKTYGMILADNGSNWFISGASDHKYRDDDLRSLKDLKGSDFEVVDTSGLRNG